MDKCDSIHSHPPQNNSKMTNQTVQKSQIIQLSSSQKFQTEDLA